MLTDSLLMIDGSAMLSKHYYGTIPKELFKEKNSEKIEVLEREIKQHPMESIQMQLHQCYVAL